ncbi:1-acyl-sn-glycerol-3-phosphate acyltransferase [Actinomyces sp. zg-332]|uniref:lysophospholipid acyltransferase family protein n=1 Tax=Actinomyces sp. zg-332 TaxID=2708340 RepID=UPI0018C1F9AE|nr:lysophospholipid acyltransferase family protein [Actinomyces sp. zg-332]QPK94640.1 1-acyl-sn-glycerol-3-phosphate acyltransferase [Actinomyces sp. zg-332]
MLLYKVIKTCVGPIAKILYKPYVEGLENVPETGSAILASNHLAVIDSFFLPLALKREIVFIGKADYFKGKGIKGKIVAKFMRSVGTIPVDRSGGKAHSALQAGLKRIESGELFGIYPEGTRSPDGKLYKGKVGVARLALLSGAKVIPVAMINTDVAQPIGKTVPKRGVPIGVVFGEPLDFSQYAGEENNKEVLRSITNTVMQELQKLSGQEYVDRYASDVKNELAEKGLFKGPLPPKSGK